MHLYKYEKSLGLRLFYVSYLSNLKFKSKETLQVNFYVRKKILQILRVNFYMRKKNLADLAD